MAKKWIIVERSPGDYMLVPETPTWSLIRRRYDNYWEAWGYFCRLKAGEHNEEWLFGGTRIHTWIF